MTTVKAVFQTNHLESILDKSIVAHQLRGDTDCELLALKVKLFIHNGNFLSEKQVRDSLPTLPSRANGMFIRLGKTGSLGPWSRVMVRGSKLSFRKNDSFLSGGFTIMAVINPKGDWQDPPLCNGRIILAKRKACYNTL